jgi:hypothetical protein
MPRETPRLSLCPWFRLEIVDTGQKVLLNHSRVFNHCKREGAADWCLYCYWISLDFYRLLCGIDDYIHKDYLFEASMRPTLISIACLVSLFSTSVIILVLLPYDSCS